MMSLPFFGIFAAFLLAGGGRRGPALLLWALSMVVLLLLFRSHSTDALDVVL
ncbi:DUF5993 family protein [Ancylobacter pratisalsi]|uniref:DUF5993 family protein n=1 Tax=Ancylobacter pratisalsi TaxID=1745854 RepID=UPI001478D7DE|nr:DUF5993 family protein [Ancylobacter pratisalsi]